MQPLRKNRLSAGTQRCALVIDLVCRKRFVGHEINPGDHIIMASVGAGMNINALVYQY